MSSDSSYYSAPEEIDEICSICFSASQDKLWVKISCHFSLNAGISEKIVLPVITKEFHSVTGLEAFGYGSHAISELYPARIR